MATSKTFMSSLRDVRGMFASLPIISHGAGKVVEWQHD